MNFLARVFNLFYPSMCVFCQKHLLKHELILCTTCRHNLPVIEIKNYSKNKIAATFYGRIPIKKAVSFLEYKKRGITQKLIHELKYKNNQKVGSFLGNWFGYELKQQNVFNDIDFIIPVPLHSKKEKTRGYNQLTTFGEALSKTLNISYKEDILQRVSSSKTQTLKQRFERFSNSNTHFFVKNCTEIENKHILLIDDVITTGATLEACCNELLKAKNCSVSIATMAYTERN